MPLLPPIGDVAPAEIIDNLLTAYDLDHLSASEPFVLKENTTLYRAARHEKGVLPDISKSSYRFGPPPSIINTLSPVPYWWLYIAPVPMTCIYEANFCGHDSRFPRKFYLDPTATASGVIASLSFPSDLKLLNLTGDIAYRLGIHDVISSSDYEWCQWAAYQLQAHGLFDGPNRNFDGLVYPSRKDKAKLAIALASSYVDTVRDHITKASKLFIDMSEYKELLDDPWRIDPPS